ncbi:MAG: RNA polymerase sigma factor [Anaerolineae bacterium]|jgi:RNA polymerase sigma-70 factor (ECF subfamily)|nr:RNA polymerase sigma factor [Anaerolineae bacterium]
MQPAITDEQITSLLPQCQRGEAAAVGALYDLYADRLYRYMLARVGDPEVAADLTTELFVRVIRHMGSFKMNERRPAASFSAWLYRIAANLITDHHRQAKRAAQVSLTEELRLTDGEPSPQHLAEQREVFARLQRAMQGLSEEQRLVILAKFGEDMSNAEVAAWLGKSEGAVKSLQHRALQALGRLLGAGDRSAGKPVG